MRVGEQRNGDRWFLTPSSILSAAIREVPAMRYALGIGGIAAIVAIVLVGWKLPPQTVIVGTLLVLIAMVVLVIFAALSSTRKSTLRPLALSMAWSFLTITVATAVLFVSCAFFSAPKSLECLLQANCGDTPDITAVIKGAPSILDALYAQKTTQVYDRLAASVQQAIPFAQFRSVTRRQLAQLGAGPIHRTLRGQPKAAGGFLFVPFEADFDETSKWLEGITFVKSDHEWELYRFDVQPESWSAATGTAHVLYETDPATVISNRGKSAIDFWLPQQGWHGTVNRILAKRGERTCDLELLSASAKIIGKNVLGGCTLAAGTPIDIVGKITAIGSNSVDVDQIKFQLAEP